MFGGLVAAEGCFTVTHNSVRFKADGSLRLRFYFSVAMAQRDRPLIVALQDFLGAGVVRDMESRRPGWQPMSRFEIISRELHRAATIPFADRFLVRGAKRREYELWRDAMADYEVTAAILTRHRPSVCSVDGCGRPIRGQQLCRSHYYRLTGH